MPFKKRFAGEHETKLACVYNVFHINVSKTMNNTE